MHARLFASAALVIAAGAKAAPRIDPIIGHHSVIQRDAPILIRGRASPGEQVTVSFAGQVREVRADRGGTWSASFPAMKAGGPYSIEARGNGEPDRADNILIGDVWLCSGQSNMEWPLKRALGGEAEVASAKDPELKLLKVPQNRIVTGPQRFLSAAVQWMPTTPHSAENFSAACYFMGRRLRESQRVPVGLIDSTWGGTAIHSWMDEAAVRATGGGRDAELVELYRKSPAAAYREFDRRWADWWRERSGDAPGSEPWNASSRLSWTPMPKIGLWEQWGEPDFAGWNGAIWARARFTLSADEAKQRVRLALGAIDDFDRTYVNGQAVGQTASYNAPRSYFPRPDQLKAGENEVLVYVLDTGGFGGFQGPASELKIVLASGEERPITGWEYARVPPEIGSPPAPPWDAQPGPATLYNGMIAPMGPAKLKGVAWYQGEADVGRPGYDRRLLAMMESWRRQFGQPQLPFLIVGLAGYGYPPARPIASAWAALMDEQRKAAFADGHAVLVSAIDIGESDDIHPPNKQEVGRRLALAAQAMVYLTGGMTGPEAYAAQRTGGGIVVRFDKALTPAGGGDAHGIELCAETQDSCRFAAARVGGASIVIADDGRPATRVRHAWSDFPIVSVYGPERLPVPTFELPIR